MVADGGRWWDFAQIPPAERLRAGAALPVLSSSASAGRTGGLGAHRRPRGARSRSWRPRNRPTTDPGTAPSSPNQAGNRAETVRKVQKPYGKPS
jgi:hypothetical protein